MLLESQMCVQLPLLLVFLTLISTMGDKSDDILQQILQQGKDQAGRLTLVGDEVTSIRHDLRAFDARITENATAIASVKATVNGNKADVASLAEELNNLRMGMEKTLQYEKVHRLKEEVDKREKNLVIYGIKKHAVLTDTSLAKSFLSKDLGVCVEDMKSFNPRFLRRGDDDQEGKPGPIVMSLASRKYVFKTFEYARTARLSNRVARDLPYAIRAARAMLLPRYNDLRLTGKTVKLKFPASLEVDGKVVFELFEGYNDKQENKAIVEVEVADFSSLDSAISLELQRHGKTPSEKSTTWTERMKRSRAPNRLTAEHSRPAPVTSISSDYSANGEVCIKPPINSLPKPTSSDISLEVVAGHGSTVAKASNISVKSKDSNSSTANATIAPEDARPCPSNQSDNIGITVRDSRTPECRLEPAHRLVISSNSLISLNDISVVQHDSDDSDRTLTEDSIEETNDLSKVYDEVSSSASEVSIFGSLVAPLSSTPVRCNLKKKPSNRLRTLRQIVINKAHQKSAMRTRTDIRDLLKTKTVPNERMTTRQMRQISPLIAAFKSKQVRVSGKDKDPGKRSKQTACSQGTENIKAGTKIMPLTPAAFRQQLQEEQTRKKTTTDKHQVNDNQARGENEPGKSDNTVNQT